MEVNVYVMFSSRFIPCAAPLLATGRVVIHSRAEHHPASDSVQQQLFKEDKKKKKKT